MIVDHFKIVHTVSYKRTKYCTRAVTDSMSHLGNSLKSYWISVLCDFTTRQKPQPNEVLKKKLENNKQNLQLAEKGKFKGLKLKPDENRNTAVTGYKLISQNLDKKMMLLLLAIDPFGTRGTVTKICFTPSTGTCLNIRIVQGQTRWNFKCNIC